MVFSPHSLALIKPPLGANYATESSEAVEKVSSSDISDIYNRDGAEDWTRISVLLIEQYSTKQSSSLL